MSICEGCYNLGAEKRLSEKNLCDDCFELLKNFPLELIDRIFKNSCICDKCKYPCYQLARPITNNSRLFCHKHFVSFVSNYELSENAEPVSLNPKAPDIDLGSKMRAFIFAFLSLLFLIVALLLI